MNPLYQHIEYLLLRNDCVIVPHFGGFVAQEESARYVETESLFFPPVRLVRFNPDLTIDDGLLLNHVCSAYHYNESEGKRAIQSMVLQLRGQLLSDGIVDFGSIGVFTQDEDGDIEFSACQAGALSPALYGLDAFSMPRLTERSKSRGRAKQRQVMGNADEHKFITIKLNRRALRRTIVAAAILMLVAVFTVPMGLLRRSHIQEASVFPSGTLAIGNEGARKGATEANSVKADAMTIAEPISESSATADSTPATEPIAEEQTADTQTYAIIFASDVSLKNAERYVAELTEKGVEKVRVYNNGRKVRVVADGYASEAEAYETIRELHAMSNEFADIWVMKL